MPSPTLGWPCFVGKGFFRDYLLLHPLVILGLFYIGCVFPLSCCGVLLLMSIVCGWPCMVRGACVLLVTPSPHHHRLVYPNNVILLQLVLLGITKGLPRWDSHYPPSLFGLMSGTVAIRTWLTLIRGLKGITIKRTKNTRFIFSKIINYWLWFPVINICSVAISQGTYTPLQPQNTIHQ